jgi:hypothetical protein
MELNNYDQTQLNILVGQAFNNAVTILTEAHKDILSKTDIKWDGFHEELVYLTKRLAQDILTARQEFAGELPWSKVGEALDNVNKERPQLSFVNTDFDKADEIQKTLINKMKLAFDRLMDKEPRSKGTHQEFAETARKHFNPEENETSDLVVDNK